jgi:hypothetical protein
VPLTRHLGHGIVELHVVFGNIATLLDGLGALVETIRGDGTFNQTMSVDEPTVIDRGLAGPNDRVHARRQWLGSPHRPTNHGLDRRDGSIGVSDLMSA